MKSILYSSLLLTAASTLFFSCVSITAAFDPPMEEVFEFEGVDQDTLFVHTGEFLASTIRDSREANEFVEKEGGKIVGDFHENVIYDSIGRLELKVFTNYNITVREGKVRIVLDTTKLIKYLTTGVGGNRIIPLIRSNYAGATAESVRQQQEVVRKSYETLLREYKSYVDGLIEDDF